MLGDAGGELAFEIKRGAGRGLPRSVWEDLPIHPRVSRPRVARSPLWQIQSIEARALSSRQTTSRSSLTGNALTHRPSPGCPAR